MKGAENAYESVDLGSNNERREGEEMKGYSQQYPHSSLHDPVGMEGAENGYESYAPVDLETNYDRREGEKVKDLKSGKNATYSPHLITTVISVVCTAILFGAVVYLLSSTVTAQDKLITEEQKRFDVEKMLAEFNSSVNDLKTGQNESATGFKDKYIKFSKSLNDLQRRQAEEIRFLKKFTLPGDCESAKRILGGNGVVSLVRGGNIYEVYCDTVTDGGNWIVFQRRMDGSVDFYRTWEEYATGFGSKTWEFWLGLETVHQLTQNGSYELRVDLTDWDGSTAYAKYGNFSISGRSDGYRLTVGGYSGNAGNSLNYYHNGQQFSTKDKDLDSWSGNCATTIHAAWWFVNCASSSLNGRYNGTSDYRSGVYWHHWGNRRRYSLKAAEMKFRKK